MNSLLLRSHQRFSGFPRQSQSFRYLNKFSGEFSYTKSKLKNDKIGQLIQYHKADNFVYRNITSFSPILSSNVSLWMPAWSISDHQNPDFTIGHGSLVQSVRHFRTTLPMHEQSSSKVEETVKKIQEQEKEKVKDLAKPTDTPSKVTQPAVIEKKTIKQRIIQELLHYYHGFRLLFIDIKIAGKLVWKLMHGNSLTRREYMLLIRTTGDVFRLVPFSVFIIVPFMEFLLPVYIKFFPGMLPSTFESASDKEAKVRSQLKVKLDMAKFLQKTLDEMDLQHNEHRSEEAKAFITFFNKLKSPEENVRATPEEIIKFSKLFEDEITLDSLSRDQLTAICKVLEVPTIGPINLLRFQLRIKLRTLTADDRMIQKEGIDSLTLSELQGACRARGMRSYGLSEPQLKYQLSEWVDLSLNEKISPSLLLLSRAMMLPEDVPTADKLKATISVLSDSAAVQTKAAIGEREGKIDNKTKIDILRDEERKIKEELEDLKEVQKDKAEVLLDKAPVISAESTSELSSKDMEVVHTAIEELSKTTKSLLVEKEEIKDLKEEIADYKEDVQELQEISKQSVSGAKVKESTASRMLLKKVDSMIGRLDKTLAELEQKEAKLQAQFKEAGTPEEAQKSELVHIDEIMCAIIKMQKVSDEAKLEQIESMLGKIDMDKDGHLKVDDILKIIETIGKDNMNLNEKQIDDIIALITKEEHIENEEKIKKVLKKSKEEHETQSKSEELVDEAKALMNEIEEKTDIAPTITADENKMDKHAKNIIINVDETAERQKDKLAPLSSVTSGNDVPKSKSMQTSSKSNKDNVL